MSGRGADVTVRLGDGELRGTEWRSTPEEPAVLAAHDLAGNRLAWAKVAESAPSRFALVAPDLRGRVRSAPLPGPWGLRRHAEDLLAVLDARELRRPVLVGHGMGAWVVLLAALRRPDAAAGLVLVDGGVPLPRRAAATDEELLATALGSTLAQLGRTYPSRSAYLAERAAEPALRGGFDRATRAHVLEALVGSGFGWRSAVRLEAVRADALELLTDDEVRDALARVLAETALPVTLLRAPRGCRDEPDPAVPDAALQALAAGSRLRTLTVADTNHVSILLGDRGSRAVCDELVAMAAQHRCADGAPS